VTRVVAVPPDYYKILEVSEDASSQQITLAFRRQAQQYHPDKLGHVSEGVRRLAEERFKDINEAYHILSDLDRRREYDRTRAAAEADREREAFVEDIARAVNRGDLRSAVGLAGKLYERFPKEEDYQKLYAQLAYDFAQQLVTEGNTSEARSYLKVVASMAPDEGLRSQALGDLTLLSAREERRRDRKEAEARVKEDGGRERERAETRDREEESREREHIRARATKEDGSGREAVEFRATPVRWVVLIILLVFGLAYFFGNERRDATTWVSEGVPRPPRPAQENSALSEAEKRQLVAERVRQNEQAGLVDSILAQATVTLSGRMVGVTLAGGSGGFWSFSIKADNNNAPYVFMCSSYDELYFRLGRTDVDWETGTKAMRQEPAHVLLYFRSTDLRTCLWGDNTCDANPCPLAIVVQPPTPSHAVTHGRDQEPLVASQSGPAAPRKQPALGVSRGIDANHANPPNTTRRSFAPKSKDEL
jgi:curved DNA-binding protein CbpA